MSIGTDSYTSNSAVSVADIFNTAGTAAKPGGYNKPSASREENVQAIRDRINELLEKMENGDIEPSYQIGGRSFTEREWDKLLCEIDEAEETMKKLVREERERLIKADEINRMERKEAAKKSAAAEQKEKADNEKAGKEKVSKESMELLTADTVSSTDMENGSEIMYVTAFGPDGIKCKKLGYIGEEGWLWEISYSDVSQYRMVMDFIEKLPKDENLSFASQKDFWDDFLKGKINQGEYLRK